MQNDEFNKEVRASSSEIYSSTPSSYGESSNNFRFLGLAVFHGLKLIALALVRAATISKS